MAKYGGGFGGGMNMQAMMQQAKKLQEQMAAAEAELEDTELTGEAGGGLVSVTIDGKKKASASFDKTGSGRHGRSGDARGSYYGSV